MPKDHSSSKRWFLQNICCMSSRSEALECEACEEAARHDLVHLACVGADLSLGHMPLKLECRSESLVEVLQLICTSMRMEQVGAFMRMYISEGFSELSARETLPCR